MSCQLLLVVLFVVCFAAAHAGPSPELLALQQQYELLIAERVVGPHDAGLETLNAKFFSALSSAADEAKKAGSLPDVLAIEEDKKLITSSSPCPRGMMT